MLTKILVSLFCLCALLVVGCSKTETTNSNGMASDKKAATPASSPAKAASTPAAPALLSAASVGVPECDEFLAKYQECINNKVPEALRAQLSTNVTLMRNAWRNATSTPQGKAGLTAACKSATEQYSKSMKQYACAF